MNSHQKSNYYFWLFLSVHTVLWTLGPALFRPTLPHDVLEGITWGLQWQLGYNKHPFLAAWLLAEFTRFFGAVDWPAYLLAQLAVSSTFIAVWRLGKEFLPLKQALIATLMLDGILFYNINSFNFTPDTLQAPIWAWMSLFFYQALTTQKLKYWLGTALFAALGLCTKYQIIIMLLPLFLFCLYNPAARKSFSKPGIYTALVFFLILITPHFIWLANNDFITITYARNASSEYTAIQTLSNHFRFPLIFLVNCILNILGLFMLLWPFSRSAIDSIDSNQKDKEHNSFTQSFLLCISLGPTLLSVIICFLSGSYFPPRWATPYYFPLGLLLIIYLKPQLNTVNIKQFAYTIASWSLLLFVIRLSSFTLFPRANSDAFLPNKQIAHTLNQLWQEKYHSAIPYLAGSNYLVSVVTPYLPKPPIPYLNWSRIDSPWVKENSLFNKGAIFIWDEGKNYTWDHNSKINTTIPPSVYSRFKDLNRLPNMTFHRSSDNLPIIIGIAILPPKNRQ